MSEKSRAAVPSIKGKRPALPPAGGEVSLEEIQDLLQDDGYSAKQRKAWLKEVLTELQDNRAKPRSRDRDELVKAIKDIIAENQDERPISDDTL
jgi:hypothetical protein